MSSKRINLMLLCASLAAGSIAMSGCVAPPDPPRAEQQPSPESVLPPATPTEQVVSEKAPALPAPTPADIRGAIARMYKNSVVVDAGRFVVGDFNGDGSQDVAVVVKPASGMLSEINSEVANWILEDPKKIVLPDPSKATQPLAPLPQPTRVEQSDTLLAVLHGHGPSGWRNPESRQTYLLKNAAGDNLKTQQPVALMRANDKPRLPRLRGDVISETIGPESGFLYYSGAKYVWYPQAGKAIAAR